jgi:hypothetical protein
MPIILGVIIVAVVVWMFSGLLHFIVNLILAIVLWPFNLFGMVIFSQITWWTLAATVLCALLFGMGPQVRNWTIAIYCCGAVVLWLLLHAVPQAEAETKIGLAIIWPYALYEMVEHPISADKVRCLQQFNENVCRFF